MFSKFHSFFPNFTGCYWVLLGFTGCKISITYFYLVSLFFTHTNKRLFLFLFLIDETFFTVYLRKKKSNGTNLTKIKKKTFRFFFIWVEFVCRSVHVRHALRQSHGVWREDARRVDDGAAPGAAHEARLDPHRPQTVRPLRRRYDTLSTPPKPT